MTRKLLHDKQLDASSTVANCRMNREREIRGTNSYAADLRFDILDNLAQRLEHQATVAWLDLCCGSGRALIQAADHFHTSALESRVRIDGIDLVSMFASQPATATCLNFQVASLNDWSPGIKYDLITCVHGLHYIGDKLGLLARTASWLTKNGLFVANIDLANLQRSDKKQWARHLSKQLRAAGFQYESRHHLISCTGPLNCSFPYIYEGADDNAGPNFTGQPAVNSIYSAR